MNAPASSAGVALLPQAELERLFAVQRAAFERERFPALLTRRDRLQRLMKLTVDNEDRIVAAIAQDFGHRSAHETRLAECYIVASATRHALRHLKRWMKPVRVATPLHLQPGRAEIIRQPVGVVGVISPWNYPLQLALTPVIGALAAGNRVLLKPSELTPATSALLRQLISHYFREDELAVVLGDAAVGQAFSALPWDHLFFTGSTAVGRAVAQAAAANLTPVTLELGGKSPALFDDDADLALVASRLVAGKLLNAGQTCIAPDYAMVPEARAPEFVAAIRDAVARLYPSLVANPDYTAIVNERHYQRLIGLIDDAQRKGAQIVPLDPGSEASSTQDRKLVPTLLLNVTDDMAVMNEEIFGPLLPIETYTTRDDAIARINRRPRPLAFYYFGQDATRREQVLRDTIAGGVTVNDTIWHFAHEELPFGGAGASGIGAYHGERGFLAFTQQKPVFHQSRLAATRLLYPPYGAAFERVLALLKRLTS